MPIYPKDHLATSSNQAPQSSCFVLMPFLRQFDEVYDAIRAACGSPDLLLSCSRADDFYGAGHIMEDILNGIVYAEYIIADVTGKNPNVFYELGISHCCKGASKVVIITQTLDDVPFDLRPLRCISYRPDPSGLRVLEHNLVRTLRNDAKDVFRFSVIDSSGYEFNERLSGDGGNFYTFSIRQALVARAPSEVKLEMMVHSQSIDQGTADFGPSWYVIKVGVSLTIPNTDWALRLDRIENSTAYLSVLQRVDAASAEQGNLNELHHVSLAVRDLERSKAFYRDILKLQQIGDRPKFPFPGAWFALPSGQELHLVENPDGRTFRDSKEIDPRDSHFAIRVNDWREANELVISEGLEMKVDPYLLGLMQLYILDPDDYVVEINALGVPNFKSKA